MNPDTIAICGALASAAFVQSSLGFGFALVAMSLLALFQNVVHAAAVVNIAGAAVMAVLVIALRRSVIWLFVRRVLPAMLVGVIAGVFGLGRLDTTLAVRVLGGSIAVIAGWNLLAPATTHTPEHPVWQAIVGLGSGVLSGAFNIGGPPLVAHLYRRPYEPDTLKGTAQMLFLATGIMRLPLAAAEGHLTADVWRDAAIALPFVAVGSAAGLLVSRRFDAVGFRRASWIVLALIGLRLLAFA